jgi:hypothetical protein
MPKSIVSFRRPTKMAEQGVCLPWRDKAGRDGKVNAIGVHGCASQGKGLAVESKLKEFDLAVTARS